MLQLGLPTGSQSPQCHLPAPPRTGAGSVATDTGTSRDGGLREQKTPLAGHEAVCLQAAGQAASTEPRDEGHRSCWPQKPSPGLLHPAGSPCTGGCRAPPAPSTAPRLPRGSALCPAPPITGLCLCKRARLGCLFFFFFFPVLGILVERDKSKKQQSCSESEKGR